jgi:hypothetical protein
MLTNFREDPERYQRRVKELETEHGCFEDA